jgi:hypothetical protein
MGGGGEKEAGSVETRQLKINDDHSSFSEAVKVGERVGNISSAPV